MITARETNPASSPAAAPRATPYRRLRHIVRTRAAERPAVYLPFARRKYPGPSPEVVGPGTSLVIDGYTRSACTFAVYAFQLAQSRPVRLAHHLHAPAQLIAAARMGIPALVVIRRPEGAILSQLVREPDVHMRDALDAYARFYESLQPYRSSFTVGDFDEITTNFGSVIRRLNARFGTSYAEFEHTEANVRACFALIKHRPTLSKALLGFESGVVSIDEARASLVAMGDGNRAAPPGELWIPSTERERSKDALRAMWASHRMARLRERAEAAYRAFLLEPRQAA